MEEEKQLSERESLQLISRMIHEAKGYFYESGISALVYGFYILVCSLITYAMEKKMISFPFHPFYIFVPVFFCAGMDTIQRRKKEESKNIYR